MSFLLLLLACSALAWLPQAVFGQARDLRMAMRHGAALAFLFTGTDHFLSAESRYVPMLPSWLEAWALELVYFTGGAEIAGALGLAAPARLNRSLRLPELRRWAGIGLAVMLAFLVIANINVAVKGAQVHGLPFGPAYYWIRPFLQPLFIIWVLYAAGVIGTAWIARSSRGAASGLNAS